MIADIRGEDFDITYRNPKVDSLTPPSLKIIADFVLESMGIPR